VIEVRRDVSLGHYNTLALPASAAAFVEVSDDAGLPRALEWAAQHELPVLPLGEGSNVVLVGEQQALLLRLSTSGVEELERGPEHVLLRVAAGQRWHPFVAWTLAQGFCGLENLALIPGTVGAAPIQNIGAYGVELSHCLVAVHALRVADGAALTLAAQDCRLGYRDSVFKHELCDQLLITAVDLRLATRAQTHTAYPALRDHLDAHGLGEPTPQQVFDAVVAIRRARLPDPAREPNAGSFFKNPVLEAAQAQALQARFAGLPGYPQDDGRVKLPAAWLIEHCGFKGRRRGAVRVHREHALVLVNDGAGRGEELLALAREIAAQVADTFAIELEIEPRVYGAAA